MTGGSFVKQLALLWRVADASNRILIAATWAGLFAEYAMAAHYHKLAVDADLAGRN